MFPVAQQLRTCRPRVPLCVASAIAAELAKTHTEAGLVALLSLESYPRHTPSSAHPLCRPCLPGAGLSRFLAHYAWFAWMSSGWPPRSWSTTTQYRWTLRDRPTSTLSCKPHAPRRPRQPLFDIQQTRFASLLLDSGRRLSFSALGLTHGLRHGGASEDKTRGDRPHFAVTKNKKDASSCNSHDSRQHSNNPR